MSPTGCEKDDEVMQMGTSEESAWYQRSALESETFRPGAVAVGFEGNDVRDGGTVIIGDEESNDVSEVNRGIPVTARIVEDMEEEERRVFEEQLRQQQEELQQMRAERENMAVAQVIAPCGLRSKWIGIASMMILIIVAVSLGITLPRILNTKPMPSESSPTVQPSFAPTLSRTAILETLVASFSSNGTLPGTETPQGKALAWLIQDVDSQVSLNDTDRWTARYALAVLYYSTGGDSPGWFDNANFLSSDHECDWHTLANSMGVECDSNYRTVSLNLPDNSLRGFVPPEIGLLTVLSLLNLRGSVYDGGTVNVRTNSISGTLPTEIGQLSRLVSLDLSQNGWSLQGPLPSEIGQMVRAVELRLNDCGFSGMIPEVIGNMPSLTFVSLSNNFLVGTVPQSLENIRCLLLDGNENVTCDWFRRRRRLQAWADRTTCSWYTPPCEL